MREKHQHTSKIGKVLPLGKDLGWDFIFFIGIGGIGMSAIARYFVANGKQVAGYDKTPTQLTTSLEKSGIKIHFEDAVTNIPTPFLDKPYAQPETLAIVRTTLGGQQKHFK